MSEQGELFKVETTWFHLFKTMIDSGDAGEMGGTAFLVYAVVKSHTNIATGQSFPSIETIAKKAKISERQVMRELQTLEKMGYLTKERLGRNNRYTLREKVEIHDGVGRPTAVATWDYLPATVQAAVADLKNVVMKGDLSGAKIVHIENLHVEIKQFVQGGTGFQINEADIAKLPPDLLAKMEKLREEARRRADKESL